MSRDFESSSNDYIEVGDVAALDITGDEVSVSVWVRLESVNGEKKVVAKWADAGGRFQYLLSITAAENVQFVINSGGNGVAVGTTTLVIDVWYHFAGIYDGSDVRIYLDGVEEDSTSKSGNIPNTTAPFRIGAGSGGAGTEQPFDGEIAHCAVWDTPLSAGEVASLAVGISPLRIQRGSLQFYAPLNGQSPEADIIGGNTGTLTGTTVSEEPPIPYSIVAPG